MMVEIDVRDRPYPGQRHCNAHLPVEQFEEVGDTGLPVGGECIDERAAEHRGIRAERQHPHDVEPRAYPGIG